LIGESYAPAADDPTVSFNAENSQAVEMGRRDKEKGASPLAYALSDSSSARRRLGDSISRAHIDRDFDSGLSLGTPYGQNNGFMPVRSWK